MIKDIAEPMFKTMLPGPLASLHFTKVDLGSVPIVFSNVLVTQTDTQGIKLDLNVDWDGKCDIKLDANMMPEVVSRRSCPPLIVFISSLIRQGVKSVQLQGRLSVLLCPLTNIIPLVCNSSTASRRAAWPSCLLTLLADRSCPSRLHQPASSQAQLHRCRRRGRLLHD
jgi:hypothetical protein